MSAAGSDSPGPPSEAVAAFGLEGPAVPLTGGQRRVWRVGSAVLKPLDTTPELVAWQSSVLTRVDGHPDFRVAPPLMAKDGSWVVAGWTAWRFEPGRPAERQWNGIIEAGRRFHRELVGVAAPPALRERSDVWAVADRLAWSDPRSNITDAASDRVGLEPPVHPADVARLVSALQPVREDGQLVHGDLTGNVLFDDHLPPLIIDFSPYWRPPGFGLARPDGNRDRPSDAVRYRRAIDVALDYAQRSPY